MDGLWIVILLALAFDKTNDNNKVNYLDDRYPRECHYSKTIGEFAKEYPYGKYAVTTSGHITAIIDGIIYDTFDPSDRIMRCAWKIK